MTLLAGILIAGLAKTIHKAAQENKPEQPDRERHYINRAFVYQHPRSIR